LTNGGFFVTFLSSRVFLDKPVAGPKTYSQLARSFGSWGPRTFALLVMGLKMKRSEVLNDLNDLIENGFLASNPDETGYIIREKFVVHCWRAFLHS